MRLKSRHCLLVFLLSGIGPNVLAQDISRSNFGEFYYLNSGLVISTYAIEPAFAAQPNWHGMANLKNSDSYTLTDKQTRFLDVQFVTCQIDLFDPYPDMGRARNRMRNCVEAHIWENDDIPQWVKIVGAAMVVGAASESGALDNEISVSVRLDSLNDKLHNLLKPKLD